MNKAHGITVLMILFGFALIAPNLHASSNYNLNEAFLMAVYENDYAIMEELLKKGADINAADREGSLTPLAVAAANGDLKLVNFDGLVKSIFHINTRNNCIFIHFLVDSIFAKWYES